MAIFGQANTDKIRYQREWHDWARSENLASLQEALEDGQDINEVVMDGLSAASICALEGKVRLFEFLREKGADFTLFDGNKMNTLMCSAKAGTVKIAAKILARGEPKTALSALNENRQTVLHFAASTGRADMIQFLLSKGAEVNVKDIDGNTPLHMSMLGNSALAVKLLLSAGADTNAENAKNQTPAKMSGGNSAARKALEDGDASHATGMGGVSFGGPAHGVFMGGSTPEAAAPTTVFFGTGPRSS